MLTKSEFCQFSLVGKILLLEECGELLYIREFKRLTIKIFSLYNFYVQAVYKDQTIESIEPLPNSMLKLFKENK